MGIVTTSIGFEMLLRWGHFLGGITWIGLLYYFNFVQTEYFKKQRHLLNQMPYKNWFPVPYGGFVGGPCLRC